MSAKTQGGKRSLLLDSSLRPPSAFPSQRAEEELGLHRVPKSRGHGRETESQHQRRGGQWAGGSFPGLGTTGTSLSFRRSSDGHLKGGQMSSHTHTYTHTTYQGYSLAYRTRTTISPDLTQNSVPDENVQITDKSQGLHWPPRQREGQISRQGRPRLCQQPCLLPTLLALPARTAVPCHLPG